jgi:hypothetical protein
MIGYVGVQEQVDKDFQRALLKASLHRWKRRLHRDLAEEHLLSFDEAKGALARWGQVYLGMRVVEIEKVTGTVRRYRDFDGSFLPRKQSMSTRWRRVDRAYLQGVELPAVSLYKIGDAYFVRDGNHRVSVARYHRVAAIDAEVVEIRGHMHIDPAQRGKRTKDAQAHLTQPVPRKGYWKRTWSARLFAFVRREGGVIGPKPEGASSWLRK